MTYVVKQEFKDSSGRTVTTYAKSEKGSHSSDKRSLRTLLQVLEIFGANYSKRFGGYDVQPHVVLPWEFME